MGRAGAAFASVGVDLMPTQERESISSVYPSGWVQAGYDFVDGGYLYNRCHLIGYQLTAENANEKNLITGTRYLNVEGMLPFENMIADFVEETEYHVLYLADQSQDITTDQQVREQDRAICRTCRTKMTAGTVLISDRSRGPVVMIMKL